MVMNGFLIHQYKCYCYFKLGQLLYEWDQSLEEVNLYIHPPSHLKACHLDCTITSSHLLLKVKGSLDYYFNVRK